MDRKLLLAARDEFRALLSQPGTGEDAFQKLFTKHPFLLSNSLPLSIAPADIVPQGRPGKAEVDFLIYPNDPRTTRIYGTVEIKRPKTQILKTPRKNIIALSSDATTALAQGRTYAQKLGTEINSPDRPLLAMGNSEYVFLILGMQAELHEKVTTRNLRKQFDQLLPHGCTLLPYDSVLSAFEQTIPPVAHILVPGSPVSPTAPPRIPPVENQAFWQLCVLDCARHANEEIFSSRRGTYPFIVDDDEDGESVLCIYNNNPYAVNATLRDDETNRFREWLRSERITELGYATYPEDGEDAGYSFAMFVDVPGDDDDAVGKVRDQLHKVTGDTFDRLNNR